MRLTDRLYCLVGLHEYRCIGVKHYLDVSFPGTKIASTMFLYRCKDCAKVKSRSEFGIGFKDIEFGDKLRR